MFTFPQILGNYPDVSLFSAWSVYRSENGGNCPLLDYFSGMHVKIGFLNQ